MCERCEEKKVRYRKIVKPIIDELKSFIDIKKYEPMVYGSNIPIKIWIENSEEPSFFAKHFKDETIANEKLINDKLFFSFKIPKIEAIYNSTIIYKYIKTTNFSFHIPEYSDYFFQKIIEIISEIDNITNISSIYTKIYNISKISIMKNLDENKYLSENQKKQIQKIIINFDIKNIRNDQFIHGDFWMENILFDPVSKETFLVDFESLALFDRNYDYSLMCLSIIQRMPEYTEKYIQLIKNNNNYNKDTFIYLFFAKALYLYNGYKHSNNSNLEKLGNDILLFINTYQKML